MTGIVGVELEAGSDRAPTLRNTEAVQAAFGTVIWVVCGVGVLAALATLLVNSKTWEQYGKSRLTMGAEHTRAAEPAAAMLEREAEIRQLLEARNHRRRRRGEAQVDIEHELRRLTEPQLDAELLGEIRDLVIARNYRRARSGKPPLDVEAEIERQLAALR